jgi:hypothetical protein
MEPIRVEGLTDKDLKLPVYADPYSAGFRPAVRRGVKALPKTLPSPRVTFADEAPKMTPAAEKSWLAVLTSLAFLTAIMFCFAILAGGCTRTPSILDADGNGKAKSELAPDADENCPICNGQDDEEDDCADNGKKPKPDKHNNGKHKGWSKHKHSCLHSNG